jgi:hypothetical protein
MLISGIFLTAAISNVVESKPIRAAPLPLLQPEPHQNVQILSKMLAMGKKPELHHFSFP